MSTRKILLIHGPNLNLLGTREPEVYGRVSLDEINTRINKHANSNNMEVKILQSNNEGEIIEFIQKNTDYDGIVINPAAYTHTSIAIGDTIKAVELPAVEVHLSNIHIREEFRKTSYIAPSCIGQISGFGYFSYILGLMAIVQYLDSANK